MRATLRTLTILGGVTAALLLAAAPAPAQMSGGVGSSSGGGRGGGGGTAGGTGGNAVQNNMPMSISAGASTDTLLGSFNNVTNVRSTVDQSNPLSGTYVNPLSQGMPNNPSPSFGQAIYANSSGGSLNSTLGGSSFGGSSGTRGSSFGTFGGATGSRGGTTGGFGSTVGGRTAGGGFGGSATIRGGTTGAGTTGGGLSFPGGSLGPAIGRYGPVTAATIRFTNGPAAPPAVVRADLQGLLLRSPRLSAPAGITVAMDGKTVVLTGRVASDDERRVAENMLRLSPGVRDVRNELQVTGGGQ